MCSDSAAARSERADAYPRFGFTRASEFGIGLTIEVPDEAMMALALDPHGHVPSGTVEYPPPFGI